VNPAIPVLLRLRDWPKRQLPFNNLILLLALRDAGLTGLRAGQASRILGKSASSDAATYLANLEKAGLVLRHPCRHHRSTCYWTLSPAGKVHVEELLTLPDLCVPA